MCDYAASTIDHTETTIIFAAGNYTGPGLTWQEAWHAPSARLCVPAFRAIFDAVGDETIDTAGDIDPGILLRILDRGLKRSGEATAWLRLPCRWARRSKHACGLLSGGRVSTPAVRLKSG